MTLLNAAPSPGVLSSTASAVRRTMAPKLRQYQADLKQAANDAWAQAGPKSNVLAVLPCGGGKTVLFGSIVADHVGYACLIAHRQELIQQISLTLARFGIRHRILAPDPLVRLICALHLEKLGVCFFDPASRVGVASVQSLTPSRVRAEAKFIHQTSLWVCDEAHHCTKDNQWGRAAELFVNSKGLGVTATPVRADGKGLGRHASGIFDKMVVGPTMRQLIDWGMLVDYRVICAETHISMAGVGISSTTGDYVLDRGKGKAAVRSSSLVGDVVRTYQKYALGKQFICFTSDLDTAEDIAAQFRAAGIPVQAVDGNTPDAERNLAMRQFERRELRGLCNLGLFGEGVDVAGCELVIGARKTMSFNVHAQQFSRMGRLDILAELMAEWDSFSVHERLQHINASRKPVGMFIDHVGNVLDPRLGLPDARNDWTLDDADRSSSSGPSDVIPNRACLNPTCLSPYLRSLPACPFCGEKPKPTPGRSGPDAVDGDLVELSDEILTALRGAVAKVAMPNDVFREQAHMRTLPSNWVASNVKKHDAHRRAQVELQDALAWWGGEQRAKGKGNSQIFREFYLLTGHDWLSVQAQDRETMIKVTGWIFERLSVDTLVQMVDTCVTSA